MSNKTQLQTNNAILDNYIARVNAATEIAAGLPETNTSGDQDMLQTRINEFNNCAYLFYEYSDTTVDYLANLDTSNVTDMENMFYNSTNLTTIPKLNTSKVIYMDQMFYGCTNLTTVPLLDTGKVNYMTRMFEKCTSLTTIPEFNTSRVYEMDYMFFGCTNLTNIPALNVSRVDTTFYMFRNCTNLKSILMYGMKVSFDISSSTKFERADLVTILNNLATVTSTQTLTMGSTNLAKLTSSDKAIATNKGWTLV